MWNSNESESAEHRLMKIILGGLPRSARRASITPELRLHELGLNSLGLILVVTKFCEEYEVDLDAFDGDFGALRTVGDLLSAGKRILESQGRRGQQ
jgi:hypothetical protein